MTLAELWRARVALYCRLGTLIAAPGQGDQSTIAAVRVRRGDGLRGSKTRVCGRRPRDLHALRRRVPFARWGRARRVRRSRRHGGETPRRWKPAQGPGVRLNLAWIRSAALAPEQTQLKKRRDGVRPIVVALVDDLGVAHAPFASGRAFLAEHGYGAVDVLCHDGDGALHVVEALELMPFGRRLHGRSTRPSQEPDACMGPSFRPVSPNNGHAP